MRFLILALSLIGACKASLITFRIEGPGNGIRGTTLISGYLRFNDYDRVAREVALNLSDIEELRRLETAIYSSTSESTETDFGTGEYSCEIEIRDKELNLKHSLLRWDLKSVHNGGETGNPFAQLAAFSESLRKRPARVIDGEDAEMLQALSFPDDWKKPFSTKIPPEEFEMRKSELFEILSSVDEISLSLPCKKEQYKIRNWRFSGEDTKRFTERIRSMIKGQGEHVLSMMPLGISGRINHKDVFTTLVLRMDLIRFRFGNVDIACEVDKATFESLIEDVNSIPNFELKPQPLKVEVKGEKPEPYLLSKEHQK